MYSRLSVVTYIPQAEVNFFCHNAPPDTWGCGAYCLPSTQWFQIQWPTNWADAAKVVAARVSWAGYCIKSDNQAAVQTLLFSSILTYPTSILKSPQATSLALLTWQRMPFLAIMYSLPLPTGSSSTSANPLLTYRAA